MVTRNRLEGRAGRRLRLAVIGTVVGMVVLVGTAVAVDREMTKGRIPSGAFRSDGTVDPNQVPDFVPALGRDGEVVGYVTRQDLGLDDNTGEAQVMAVYGDDLSTVIGHMVAGVGYVPLGTDPASLPTFHIVTSADDGKAPTP
jgi:hypothetical protein